MRVLQYIPKGHSRSAFSKDIKELKKKRYSDALESIDEMIADLKVHGRESEFVRSLGDGLFELKTTSRGGLVGGARVYGFFAGEAFALLGAAEVKKDRPADAMLIARVRRYRSEWVNSQRRLSKLAKKQGGKK